MAKGQKSSASSATRKKHAKRAGSPTSSLPPSNQTKPGQPKGGKKSKKEPKQKIFIPPPKYAPAQPDPLDTLGLVHTLPSELVVVLRRLGKKDVTTRARALGELGEWVGRLGQEGEGGAEGEVGLGLGEALPVWYHHLPALLLHPSRQLRLLALQTQAALLASPLRRRALKYVSALMSEDEQSRLLGTWSMSAYDIDRGVASVGRPCWEGAVAWSSSEPSDQPTQGREKLLLTPSRLTPQLLAFLSQTLHDPNAVFLSLHPPSTASAPSHAPPLTKGGKRPPPPVVKKVEESARREEELELEEERIGRLRSGALGALAWVLDTFPHDPASKTLPEGAEDLLLSAHFWSHLSPLPHPPFRSSSQPGLGAGQPAVRRAAWYLLRVLVAEWPSTLETGGEGAGVGVGEVLAGPVLRSAWVESEGTVRAGMWEGLLSYLTKFPRAWEVEARSESVLNAEDGNDENDDEHEHDDEDEEDDEDDENDETKQAHTISQPAGTSTSPTHLESQAYSEFLEFLRTACRGSSTTGYPTILVILSTLPASILPLSQDSLLELFRAFRYVSDERVLPQSDVLGWRAFIASLLESMVYLSGKACNATPETYPEASKDGVQYVVAQEFERLASLLLEMPSLLSDAEVGRSVARTLVRLAGVDRTLFDTAWVPLTTKFAQSTALGVAKALSTLHTSVHGTVCDQPVRHFVLQYGGAALSSVDWSGATAGTASLDTLLAMLQQFGPLLFSDAPFEQTIRAMLHEHLPFLLSSSTYFPPKAVASLLVQYLTHARTEEAEEMWHSILSEVGRRKGEGKYEGLHVLQELCASVEQGFLVRPLHPKGGELKELAEELSKPAEEGDVKEQGLLSRLLRNHERFLDTDTTSALLGKLASLFTQAVQTSLRHTSGDGKLHHLLRILQSIPASVASTAGQDLLQGVVASLFLAAFVLPCSHVDLAVSNLARKVLDQWLASIPQKHRRALLEEVRSSVRECLEDVSVLADPADIVDAYQHNASVLEADSTAADLLPPDLLNKHLRPLLGVKFSPILSAMDPLVPATSDESGKGAPSGPFARSGNSVYARLVRALLQSLTGGQSVALPAKDYWAVRHFLTLAALAEDFIAEPGLEHAVFAPQADISELEKLVHLIDLVIRHTFSSSVGDLSSAWHQSAIAHLRKVVASSEPSEDPLATLTADIYIDSVRDKSVLAARTLQRLMSQIAQRSTVADLERWLAMAQNLEDKDPLAAMAIILAIKGPLAESPRLNRYHNELASRLSGVSPSKANSQGLPLLRLLIASAPASDSLAPFIPQQRTVFLVQSLQKWVVSDEDLDEEVDRRLGELFDVLAPGILDVPGGHWDFIFESLESNLEASTADDLDLPLLYSSLRLLGTIRDLAIASSVLRESWSDHESQVLQLIRQLFLTKLDVDQRSRLQRACRDMVIELVQDLPPSLIDDATMQALYARLSDPSVEVQKTAYHLLHAAIPRITEQRVIEAAVNTSAGEDEDPVPRPLFTLPPELIYLLLEPLDSLDDDDPAAHATFGRLLGWMVLFDFFADASPALKANYVEQLRSGNLLDRSLFASLIPLLPILKTGRPLNVALWDIEEFYVELYDEMEPIALSVFAAHLFYRALSTIPSLIRTWWMDIKDRQLSSGLATFASTHFSPILVSAEFAKLKQPQAEEELAHENLSLKIATNVSEVTVAYTIDEQQMELGIRLPPDFPLHGVEVRDIKRVGVPVEKWRQWMLQVQQTITSQNGFLLDALILFKKNVTLYFEGVVECAICYSVISTTDRSLPTKPCKTCKNLFHNSCLYKWFNTSNQSSCPLCRSQF